MGRRRAIYAYRKKWTKVVVNAGTVCKAKRNGESDPGAGFGRFQTQKNW